MATTTGPEAQVIDTALADFRQMMASDGYRVLWAPEPDPAPDSARDPGPEAGTRLTSPQAHSMVPRPSRGVGRGRRAVI